MTEEKATTEETEGQDTGLDLEAEAAAEPAEESEEIPGGVQTTDPTFADGAMEVPGSQYPPEGTI